MKSADPPPVGDPVDEGVKAADEEDSVGVPNEMETDVFEGAEEEKIAKVKEGEKGA